MPMDKCLVPPRGVILTKATRTVSNRQMARPTTADQTERRSAVAAQQAARPAPNAAALATKGLDIAVVHLPLLVGCSLIITIQVINAQSAVITQNTVTIHAQNVTDMEQIFFEAKASRVILNSFTLSLSIKS